MEAKDTVMNTIQVHDKARVDITETWQWEWVRPILEAQAEITAPIFYKAGYNKALAQLADMTEECKQIGRKEVVEFIGEDPFEHNFSLYEHKVNDCFACKWEAKLKEWGF